VTEEATHLLLVQRVHKFSSS